MDLVPEEVNVAFGVGTPAEVSAQETVPIPVEAMLTKPIRNTLLFLTTVKGTFTVWLGRQSVVSVPKVNPAAFDVPEIPAT